MGGNMHSLFKWFWCCRLDSTRDRHWDGNDTRQTWGCSGKHSCADGTEAGWQCYGLKCVPEDSGSSKLKHPQHRPLFCRYCHHEPQRKGSTKKAYLYVGNIVWADESESIEEDIHRIVQAGLQPETLLPLL